MIKADQMPLFFAVYKTEISSKVKVDMPAMVPKTKQDSILHEFTKDMIGEMSKTAFTIVLSDSVLVYSDSTVIKSRPAAGQGNFLNTTTIDINNSELILKNGLLYDIKGKLIEAENPESNLFYLTGKKEKDPGL